MFCLQPRRFSSTVPPPNPGPGTPPSEGSKNTALYVGAAAVGLGGLYYYYYASDPRARSDAERVKQKSHELSDTTKDSVHNKLQQGQNKVDEYRVRVLQPFQYPRVMKMTDGIHRHPERKSSRKRARRLNGPKTTQGRR